MLLYIVVLCLWLCMSDWPGELCVCVSYYWFGNPYRAWPTWLIYHGELNSWSNLWSHSVWRFLLGCRKIEESGTNALPSLAVRLRLLHKTLLENMLSTSTLFKSVSRGTLTRLAAGRWLLRRTEAVSPQNLWHGAQRLTETFLNAASTVPNPTHGRHWGCSSLCNQQQR